MFYVVDDEKIVGVSSKKPNTSMHVVESSDIYEVGYVRDGDSDVFVLSKTLEEQTVLASSECTARIESQWNQVGQNNAILGLYGDDGKAECTAWIASNRTALTELLAREDILDIEVTDNQYWPVYDDVLAELSRLAQEAAESEAAAEKNTVLSRIKNIAGRTSASSKT